MKVKEMIEELSKINPENECVLLDGMNEQNFRFVPINSIEVLNTKTNQTLVVLGFDYGGEN